MTRVLTVGVFDLFHVGHLNLFRRAKAHGDYLIVAVHDDKRKTKGKDFCFDILERTSLIKELRLVDEVVVYERVDLLVERVDFAVFCYGPDQNHVYFERAFAYCRRLGKKLVCLDRTPGVSSTIIGEFIEYQRRHEDEGRFYS